jgi:hypothetical protein
MVGSLKMNTALEYSTRVVQEGDRRCKKSTLNDLAYLTPLRIPLMNPVGVCAKTFLRMLSVREKSRMGKNISETWKWVQKQPGAMFYYSLKVAYP